MKKKAVYTAAVLAVMALAVGFWLWRVGHERDVAANVPQTPFLSGHWQAVPELNGMRIEVERVKKAPGKQFGDRDGIAIACELNINRKNYGEVKNFGSYINNSHLVILADKTVKEDRYSALSYGHYHLPESLSQDMDIYWADEWRIVFDKHKNVVVVLKEDGLDAFLVSGYQVSGLAIGDLSYLGAYRVPETEQVKMLLADAGKVYAVDLATLRQEEEYDLRGYRAVGVNLGVWKIQGDKMEGVFLVPRDNRGLYYMSLPSGDITMVSDWSGVAVDGEVMKVVTGWSGRIVGGAGVVMLVKEKGRYILYDGGFGRRTEAYLGQPFGEVKDIYWTIIYGVTHRAGIVLIENNDGLVTREMVEADAIYKPR